MAELHDILDIDELNDGIDKGYISGRYHPTLSLRIYNYTPEATFSNEPWTRAMCICRGLIVAPGYRVIARPFCKFWNFNDERHPETTPEYLPGEPPILTEKMDGSLGIGYCANGEKAIATRGSFDSDQAKWATAFHKDHYDHIEWPVGITPLFEIIYPENAIVVDYNGESKLVLLGAIDNETGADVDEALWPKSWKQYERPRKFDLTVAEAAQRNDPNAEGFVACWPRKDGPSLRVKIKFEEYRRLHKLMFHLNTRVIWEALREGQPIKSFTDGLSLDASVWASDVAYGMLARHLEGSGEVNNWFYTRPVGDRKVVAQYWLQHAKSVAAALFKKLDGKPYDDELWKLVKPAKAEFYRKAAEETA